MPSSPSLRTGPISAVFAIAVVLLSISVPASHGQIDCYECTVHPPLEYMNKTTKLCSKFNGSDYFKVHCPNSTYCMKKSFQLELQTGKVIKGSVRGCTQQLYEYRVFSEGKWKTESAVEYDAYKAGCYSGNDNELRTSETKFCYCDQNLCNGAEQPVTNISAHTDTIAVIIVYNIMRFLKTHTQPA